MMVPFSSVTWSIGVQLMISFYGIPNGSKATVPFERYFYRKFSVRTLVFPFERYFTVRTLCFTVRTLKISVRTLNFTVRKVKLAFER